SEYIFTTQMEKWKGAGGAEVKNIQFFTYARLMRMEPDALAEIKPDYIILDEFHRCGAAQWGGGVERLREMYPGAKVLGLAATNIRYLDNQRDMAWELFGGNVASELTLGAAVATGILPAPKYVLSVYSYQKELKQYEMRVRQARNKAVRDKAEKELEALRRALEKADGLEEVFARHMLPEAGKVSPGAETAGQTANSGKYIVFCASYEHLLEMRELAPEWFAKVDAKPHIYTAYSDDPATSAEFEAFKADTSGHLKLLYCIDMLNEGIHVDGVDGVILLRPTVSPTIYKQQIGRALASGGKKIPVIFDIVMNIENLCSIGAMEEELREAVFAYRENGRGGEVVTEHFRVVDEVEDCRRLFAQLNETLAASWDAMYAMAKEYYETYGNLEVPATYATADGYSLGAWIATQRKVYAGKTAGCLSGEQVERLNSIGMRWQGAQEMAWESNFAEAERYFKTHGDLDIPADYVTENGCRLGRWLRRQREVCRKLAGVGQKQGDVVVAGQGQEDAVIARASGANKKLSWQGKRSIHMERAQRLARIGMVWENTWRLYTRPTPRASA
ncbi:MAG: Helicase associated domain protein, partial [Lachnospiraceae bacterium]|nr:Helicase associated domain protein [Lachnospiraceae bacterium]